MSTKVDIELSTGTPRKKRAVAPLSRERVFPSPEPTKSRSSSDVRLRDARLYDRNP
jgi:hypothetical protein